MAEAWVFPQPYEFGFWLENVSVSGGTALNGEEQNVFGEAMRWRARAKCFFRTADQIRSSRGLFARLQGRAGTILVPTFDGKRVSWPVEIFDTTKSTGVVLHPGITREPLLEGTAYQSPVIPAKSEVTCTLTDAASLRATSVNMTFAQGGPPLSGQYFGIANALYIVKSVTGPVSSVYTVSFIPPLRAAAADNATVKWTRPVCEMRQASDDQGLKELQSLRFADLSLEFVENF